MIANRIWLIGAMSLCINFCTLTAIAGNFCNPVFISPILELGVPVFNAGPLYLSSSEDEHRIFIVANDDILYTSEDFTVPFDILSNDLGDIDTNSVLIVEDPRFGIVSYHALTGRIIYNPDLHYNGTDTLKYSVADFSGNIDTAEVIIVIYPKNDSPQLRDDFDTVLTSSPIILYPLANDTDTNDAPGGLNPFTILVATAPSAGIAISISTWGAIGYLPNPGFTGIDSIEYFVCDLGTPLPAICTTAWIYLSVADSIQIVTEPPPMCPGDSVQLIVEGFGPFTWTPAAGLSCTDCDNPWASPSTTTTYVVSSDFGGCCLHYDSVTVVINPLLVTIAENDTLRMLEDIPSSIDILDNDDFPDIVNFLSSPSLGTYTFTDPLLTYSPDADQNGIDSIQYQICSASCGECDTATIIILIEAVNDPPLVVDDITSLISDIPTLIPVLDNDSDVDGYIDTSTLEILDVPIFGTVNIDFTSGEILYSASTGFTGIDSFQYVVCDNGEPSPVYCDSAWVVIRVDPPVDSNMIPIAEKDFATVYEDSFVVIKVLINDSDADNSIDSSSLIISTPPINGTALANPLTGEINYTPMSDFYGTDSLFYEICDDDAFAPACAIGVVCITVLPVNDPPIALDDFVAVDTSVTSIIITLDNDSDIDGNLDFNTWTVLTEPLFGTYSYEALSGLLSYTPLSGFEGNDSLHYLICDDGTPLPSLCDSAWLIITVTDSFNRFAPVAVNDTVQLLEDDSLNIFVALNDTDPDDNLDTSSAILSIIAVNGIVLNRGNGEFAYTPDPDYWGMDSFQYSICDRSTPILCDQAWVIINVTPVNDSPVAEDDFSESALNTSTSIDVLNNDSDVDLPLGDTLSVSVITPPENGSLGWEDDQFLFLPDQDWCGEDSFQYLLCDSSLACDSAWVYLSILCSDSTFYATDDYVFIQGGEDVLIRILENDHPAADSLCINIEIEPNLGKATLDGARLLYTPQAGWNGVVCLRYSVCDTLGINSAQADVCIETNESGIVVAEGISPNSDGKNDTWVISGLLLWPNHTISVFNRWGTEVLNTSEYTNTWNGEFNGKLLPSGTYFYLITLDATNSNSAILNGTISLRY